MAKLYPSYLFRDPLLNPAYLQAVRVATPIVISNTIDKIVEDDHLLHTYITRLDEEIRSSFQQSIENEVAQAFWVEDNWTHLADKFMDETRKHGWCVVQFYELDESNPERWRVFSVQQFEDYIKEDYKDKNGNIRQKLVGMKFKWADFLGNQFSEKLKFEDEFTFLIKYRYGNDKTFALPDLSQDIITLNTEIRQIRGQLSFSAAKPSFLHFLYGKAMDDTNSNLLQAKLKGVDTSAAIGMSEDALKEIRCIENKNIEIIEPAFEKLMNLFAGTTRLPVSFYTGGEKENAGISDVGTKIDVLTIQRKKMYIFLFFKPIFIMMFKTLYNIDISEINLSQEPTLEDIEQADPDGPTKSSENNGQKD